MKRNSQQRGFIQIVILAIVVIAALGYFNIDLRTLFENPVVQKVWHIFVVAWDTYLKPMFGYLYTTLSSLFK